MAASFLCANPTGCSSPTVHTCWTAVSHCALTWCRLVEDTAWHPVMKTEVEEWTGAKAFLFKTFLGSPLKLWASVGHWLIWHFDLGKFSENQKPRVRAATCHLIEALGWEPSSKLGV